MGATQASTAIGGGGGDALRHWQALHADGGIQFAPLPPYSPPPSPAWLVAFSRFLRWIFEPLGRLLGMGWPLVQRLLIVVAACLALWLIWQIAAPLLARARQRKPAEAEAEWVPASGEALALLADADRLAETGDYDAAVHLLLARSVRQIAESRPEWLSPASTAREIAGLSAMPARARAFAEIANRVEASRYALRALAEGDWQAARTAYADFALQRIAA